MIKQYEVHIAVFTECRSQHNKSVLGKLKACLPEYTLIRGKKDTSTGGAAILISEAVLNDFSKTEIFTATGGHAHGNIVVLRVTLHGSQLRPTSVVGFYG